MTIKILLFPIVFTFYACSSRTNDKSTISGNSKEIVERTYRIILKTYNFEPITEDDSIQLPGEIDVNTVKNLSDPLKGLTAFYSAMGGSYCHNDSCDLTTTLGLGTQGSEHRKNLIKKYLPNDSVAEFLVMQDCYLRPDGASSFNAYKYLTIADLGDTVKVSYTLYNYDHGNEINHTKLDIYSYRNGSFRKVNRDDSWIR